MTDNAKAYTRHLHTTLGRTLTAKAETEQQALAAVQDQLQPGEKVNETAISPEELSNE